jgi:hypothetical protein
MQQITANFYFVCSVRKLSDVVPEKYFVSDVITEIKKIVYYSEN